ncbi:MAG: hypothetical protein U1E60_16080 [Reyranellaceae bacterium]
MESEWFGLFELFVVLAFALGWGVVELYTLRLDKRRAADAERAAALRPPVPPPSNEP